MTKTLKFLTQHCFVLSFLLLSMLLPMTAMAGDNDRQHSKLDTLLEAAAWSDPGTCQGYHLFILAHDYHTYGPASDLMLPGPSSNLDVLLIVDDLCQSGTVDYTGFQFNNFVFEVDRDLSSGRLIATNVAFRSQGRPALTDLDLVWTATGPLEKYMLRSTGEGGAGGLRRSPFVRPKMAGC